MISLIEGLRGAKLRSFLEWVTSPVSAVLILFLLFWLSTSTTVLVLIVGVVFPLLNIALCVLALREENKKLSAASSKIFTQVASSASCQTHGTYGESCNSTCQICVTKSFRVTAKL